MTWPVAVVGALLSTTLVGHPVFSFADADIDESSGLVDLGSLMVTTNDSGGDPLVFVVDPATGETVGRTTFTSSVTDVEALAPAGRHAVWVGDIGDNNGVRQNVQVYRVEVGRGDRTVSAPAYDLVYPDGPRDAESLVVGRDGRLRIVSKGIFGGRVYVAPKTLDPDKPNRLKRGPAVSVFATDAALFPDGRHVLVRGYDDALVATFPAFTPVARVDLPLQEQGEAVSIGRSGRIRLSSEGEHSEVLAIRLPADVRAKLEARDQPTPAPGTAADGTLADPGRDPVWPWLAGGGALVGLLGVLLVRRRR